MWNNLNVFYNHLVLTGRLPTHCNSVFTKNSVSTLPNTLAARIFMRAEIDNWYYKTQLGFILTISKNVQDRVHFLINILAIITALTLTWVEIDFLELLIFFYLMPVCHCVTMSMLEFTNDLSTSILQNSCVPWTNRCLEIVEPVSTLLLWLF